MRRTKRKLRAAVIAAASTVLLAGMVALAPGADAVTPDTATVRYDCGTLGETDAKLTAAQSGTDAWITVELLGITAPLSIQPLSLTEALVLNDTGTGNPVTFTGNPANPFIAVGDPLILGPLRGTVASGESLDTLAGTYNLTFVMYGITFHCRTLTAMYGGPFMF
ncbi:hypothetical protein OHB00_20315 [Streptomyces sp. NBC_00631]|uniref:hypothetical protein n=1 Tax=Streptomyces sp. NBC_00631 TaxID=2975793 RepID=UPI0030DF886B